MQSFVPTLLMILAVGVVLSTLKLLLRKLGRGAGSPTLFEARYHLRDDFLSRAEAGFYHQLVATAGNWAIVLTKVNLADLLYAVSASNGSRLRAWNQINRKHVDFVLCDPQSLRPLLAVELDDSSHAHSKRIARDRLVDSALVQAGLPIARIPLQVAYSKGDLASRLEDALRSTAGQAYPLETPSQPSTVPSQAGQWNTLAAEAPALGAPLCPRCGASMVTRSARRGSQAGQAFWGCPNYPRCRGTRPAS